mmetsp:Transcript_73202/g.208552  ORF Transcript_73202/g.208552 Transcript_73202/m.208552 type:complete len:318 (-) Transcript_73202:453-1406(-)
MCSAIHALKRARGSRSVRVAHDLTLGDSEGVGDARAVERRPRAKIERISGRIVVLRKGSASKAHALDLRQRERLAWRAYHIAERVNTHGAAVGGSVADGGDGPVRIHKQCGLLVHADRAHAAGNCVVRPSLTGAFGKVGEAVRSDTGGHDDHAAHPITRNEMVVHNHACRVKRRAGAAVAMVGDERARNRSVHGSFVRVLKGLLAYAGTVDTSVDAPALDRIAGARSANSHGATLGPKQGLQRGASDSLDVVALIAACEEDSLRRAHLGQHELIRRRTARVEDEGGDRAEAQPAMLLHLLRRETDDPLVVRIGAALA